MAAPANAGAVAVAGPVSAPSGAAAAPVQPRDLSFDTLARLFKRLREVSKGRLEYLKKFIDLNIDKASHDAFSVFRLVMPALDRDRGNYGLQEAKLCERLISAAGVDRKSKEAAAVLSWKKGSKSAGAGDLAFVLQQHIFDTSCSIDPDGPKEKRKTLKVHKLNEELDKLAEAAGNATKQAGILRGLMHVTTPEQMSWIVQIILKHLKINAAEKTIFDAWHKNAAETYDNNGMNLRFIFDDMCDASREYNTSIKPGVPVRPQLAWTCRTAAMAFSKMQHRGEEAAEFLIETKFDGERMQVHRCADGKICYFSRKAIEHGQRSSYDVIDDVIRRGTRGACVLDGELIVWNTKKRAFEPFGSLKPIISAIGDKKRADSVLEYNEIVADPSIADDDYEAPRMGDCELMYIAFDVLHNGTEAVIHKPLRERQHILAQLVVEQPAGLLNDSCVRGRVVALLPDKTWFDSKLGSRIGRCEEDISAMLLEAARLREEGIVVKRLDAPWMPNDRWGSWVKLKPSYLKGIDLDPVVIGAWRGRGSRGGQFAMYLLALAEPPGPDGEVTSWVSFCKVGTGLNDHEREAVHQQIEPLCIDAQDHPAPACYKLSGYEKPEVWVTDPRRSVVFQVQGDLRTIRTTKSATGYTLRFPTVQVIRGNKTGAMASSIRELEEWVQQEKERGEVALGEAPEVGTKRRRVGNHSNRASKRARGHQVVAARRMDVGKVEAEAPVLTGCSIWFANYGNYNKDELVNMVRKLGGEVTVAYLKGVTTHIVAGAENERVQHHKEQDHDVISITWLLECMRQQRHVLLKPRHYIFMSQTSRHVHLLMRVALAAPSGWHGLSASQAGWPVCPAEQHSGGQLGRLVLV